MERSKTYKALSAGCCALPRPLRSPPVAASRVGRRYRAGDILTVRLTAQGYRQERARIFFRNGQKPLILG
ncbi:MAG: hypothetical protein ACXVE8_17700 [Solirubrobacteraceae bacterium]